MKRFLIAICAALCMTALVGCSIEDNQNFENIDPSAEYHESLKAETAVSGAPVNYMDEIKAEVHDELFREETTDTIEIVDRIFKHLEIETLETVVQGDEATAIMKVKTINAAQAWITASENYVEYCASNLFSEAAVDDATLYEYYLNEFEYATRKADYIYFPASIEMVYRNHRWEWRMDDDVINIITGGLLAAIEGEFDSYSVKVLDIFATEDIIVDEIEKMLNELDGVFDDAIQDAVNEIGKNSTPSDPNVTVGMVNAAKEARDYLAIMSFSKEGLAKQLRYEGYTEPEIEYALKEVGY